MKRREVLAAGAAVTFAGCTGSQFPGIDAGGDNGGADSGDADSRPRRSEPDDAGAVEDQLTAAVVAFDAAFGELESQTNHPFGEIHLRSPPISADPITAHLDAASEAVDAGRDLDGDADQRATLDALDALEGTVRGFVGILESTPAITGRVESTLAAVEEGSFDGARSVAADLADAATGASEAFAAVRETASDLDDERLSRVGAVNPAALHGQLARLEADLEAAGNVAAAVGPLLAAEETFWPAYEGLVEEVSAGDDDAFFVAAGQYAAAGNTVTRSPAFEADADAIECYATRLARASTTAIRVVSQHASRFYRGADSSAAELEGRLNGAADCGLRDLDEAYLDRTEIGYDMRDHTEPEDELELDVITHLEEEVLVVDVNVANPTPYDIEASIRPEPYDRQGSLGIDSTRQHNPTIEAGSSWQPEEPWEFDRDEANYVDADVVAVLVDWA